MGLQVECPECGHRNPEGVAKCKGMIRYGEKKGEKCGFSRLTKTSGKIYWIDYRDHGKRKRERIGPSKAAAEARLLKIQQALVEDQHVERDKNATVTLAQLFNWFLNLQEVRGLECYCHIKAQVKALRRLLNQNHLIRDLSRSQLENYVSLRLQGPSPNRLGYPVAAKTVEEKISLLRNMLNRALSYEFITSIPISRYPNVRVDSVRKRIKDIRRG